MQLSKTFGDWFGQKEAWKGVNRAFQNFSDRMGSVGQATIRSAPRDAMKSSNRPSIPSPKPVSSRPILQRTESSGKTQRKPAPRSGGRS